MLRALLARFGLIDPPSRQLELALGGDDALPERDQPVAPGRTGGRGCGKGTRGKKTVMPDREVGGRFNPGGAPRGDLHPTGSGADPLLSLALGASTLPAPPSTRPTAPLPAAGTQRANVPPPPPMERSRTDAHSTAVSPPRPVPPLRASDDATADLLLRRLVALGMRGISTLRLTQNRSTLVSFRAATLRLHAAFQHADDDVLRAVAVFVSGRGAARAAARRIIVAYEIPRDAARRPPRRARLHPDDAALAERLRAAHDRLNRERFGGSLQSIRVTVSRRMTTRLGHYAPARSHPGGAEIAISRRHIRRHGWREAFDTLLHEMVHQWQEESGHPIDHGPHFRRKAREVGTTPRARRVLR